MSVGDFNAFMNFPVKIVVSPCANKVNYAYPPLLFICRIIGWDFALWTAGIHKGQR